MFKFAFAPSEKHNRARTSVLCAPAYFANAARLYNNLESAIGTFMVDEEPWTLEISSDWLRPSHIDFEERSLIFTPLDNNIGGKTRNYSYDRARRVVKALNAQLDVLQKHFELDSTAWNRFNTARALDGDRITLAYYGDRVKIATAPNWLLSFARKFAFEFADDIWLLETKRGLSFWPNDRQLSLAQNASEIRHRSPSDEITKVISAINANLNAWKAEIDRANAERKEAWRRQNEEAIRARRENYEKYGAHADKWPQ